MKIPVDWLLEGPAWIRYRTRIDLLGEKESSPAAVSDRIALDGMEGLGVQQQEGTLALDHAAGAGFFRAFKTDAVRHPRVILAGTASVLKNLLDRRVALT